MTPTILNSVKGPILLGIVSAVCSIAVTMLWLKFPSLVPLVVFMIVGFVGAVTFIVSEIVVVLRVARMLSPPGPLASAIRNLPPRAFLGLLLSLVFCNGALLYVCHLRPSLGYILVANLAAIVAWLGARLAAARYIERKTARGAQ